MHTGCHAGRPRERTDPACPACLTPRTQDACAPRKGYLDRVLTRLGSFLLGASYKYCGSFLRPLHPTTVRFKYFNMECRARERHQKLRIQAGLWGTNGRPPGAVITGALAHQSKMTPEGPCRCGHAPELGGREAVLPCRRTEPNGFEAAALPHLNQLFRTALRLVGNHSDAEDVVQETYLEAWKSFHRFEPGTNCRAWLFKILFHRIHHHRRKWFGTRRRWESDDILEESLAYEPPVPEHLSDDEVLRALQEIPASFREAVLLADVHEFTYKEISDILQIPLGTVMSRISRARRMLRSGLAQFARSLGIQTAREQNQARSSQ